MIRLYLVRHAIAVDRSNEGALPDSSRSLTGKGRRRFRRTARALAKLAGPIDDVFTSPLVRAVQTAEILAAALGRDEVEVLEELQPDVSARAVLQALSRRVKDGASVALVGHDPQMSELLAVLGHLDPTRANEVDFRKGAVVRIDVGSLPQAKQAKPRWWLPPKARTKEKGLPFKRQSKQAPADATRSAARVARTGGKKEKPAPVRKEPDPKVKPAAASPAKKQVKAHPRAAPRKPSAKPAPRPRRTARKPEARPAVEPGSVSEEVPAPAPVTPQRFMGSPRLGPPPERSAAEPVPAETEAAAPAEATAEPTTPTTPHE